MGKCGSQQWLCAAAAALLLPLLYFLNDTAILGTLASQESPLQGLSSSSKIDKGTFTVRKRSEEGVTVEVKPPPACSAYSCLTPEERQERLQCLLTLGCQSPCATAVMNQTSSPYARPYNQLSSDFAGLCSQDFGKQLYAELAAGYELNLFNASKGTGVIEEAYVSFIRGDGYALLVTNPIKSVHSFSSRPIVLFVAGELTKSPTELWPPAEYPRLVVYRMPPGTMHIWFDKLRAALLSPVIRGAIVESDTLPTMHADRLFKLIARHGTWFPLLPVHPAMRLPEPDCELHAAGKVYPKHKSTKACGGSLPYPAEQRSVPYMHAHVMWNATARPFLAAVLETCATGREDWVGHLDCTSDEHALNYALWNTKADKQLCLMDPNRENLGYWTAQSWAGDSGMGEAQKASFLSDTICFMYLHGEKDIAGANNIRIKVEELHASGGAPMWCYGPGPQPADGSPRQRMWLKDEKDIEEAGRVDDCII